MDKLLFILVIAFITTSSGVRAVENLRYQQTLAQYDALENRPEYNKRLGRNQMRRWVLVAENIINDYQ